MRELRLMLISELINFIVRERKGKKRQHKIMQMREICKYEFKKLAEL